jgi:hypothetical protein
VAIRVHQCSSGIIRVHQGSSGIISVHQWPSGFIRDHQGSSGFIIPFSHLPSDTLREAIREAVREAIKEAIRDYSERHSERLSERHIERLSERLPHTRTSSSPITSTWTKVSSERGIVVDGSFASSLVGSVGTSVPVEGGAAPW